MDSISVIIPHKNRHSLLYQTLQKLNEQNVSGFEVVVVDDHSDIPPREWIEIVFPDFKPEYKLVWETNSGRGPNSARNIGVNVSSGNNIIISGSDTVPTRTFVMEHMLDLQRNSEVMIQGFTPFHPHVMDTEFMVWLDSSGIQANWGALRNENGWKRQADGFCLTTNLSMTRDTFDNLGGFSNGFPGAAWDDIEFGIRARKLGVTTLFNHKAVNFHYHKYNITSFANRQKMEGRNRKYLCLEHPEMAMQMFPLEMIRQASEQSLEEWIHQSISLSYVKGIAEEKNKVWAGTMQLASFVGVWESLEQNEYLKIIPELKNQESVVYLFALMKAQKEGNDGYVQHCLGWITEKESQWIADYTKSIYYKQSGQKNDSYRFAMSSMSAQPSIYGKELLKCLM